MPTLPPAFVGVPEGVLPLKGSISTVRVGTRQLGLRDLVARLSMPWEGMRPLASNRLWTPYLLAFYQATSLKVRKIPL